MRSAAAAGPERGPESGPARAFWLVYAVLRTAGCWVVLALLTIAGTAIYLPAARISPHGRVVKWVERAWVWSILAGSNVDLAVRGLERVQPGRSYIVMANHRSLYDIPALHYLLGRGRDLRWIGKKELLKVPVFGWTYGASRHIAIDRQNRARSIAALKDAAAETDAGVSFVIMPEGTRWAGEGLLPFKKGGFHLAIDTGLPILPVAIIGSEKLMRKGAWWILPGRIEVVVRKPIETAGLEKSELEDLMQKVRTSITAAMQEGS